MKRTIEIECPDGYKPVYNTTSGKVEIVPEKLIDRIKTYEDATNEMGVDYVKYAANNKSIEALAKLQLIIDVLNEGHKFDLLKGKVWYPWVRFYKLESIPKNSKIIERFRYQSEEFVLVGGCANYGSSCGCGAFHSVLGVGNSDSDTGMMACKSEEIAKYVSARFGKLIFEACFARHFEKDEFEWLG